MRLSFLVCMFLLLPIVAFAAAGDGGKSRNSLPIELKANELHSDNTSRTATFVGKVSARQGDITIYSDKLVIHYAEQTRDVDRVEATGNVSIIQGERRALAGHAVYDNRAGVITLDGNPRVYQGESTVTGRVITYYVDEQKSTVSGGPKPGERVEAVIIPRAKDRDGGTRK